MKDIDYLILGKKEYFEIFERSGFNTIFINKQEEIKKYIQNKSTYELIITQDIFYDFLCSYVNSLGLKIAIFCLPENPEVDKMEEILNKMIQKAIGIKI